MLLKEARNSSLIFTRFCWKNVNKNNNLTVFEKVRWRLQRKNRSTAYVKYVTLASLSFDTSSCIFFFSFSNSEIIRTWFIFVSSKACTEFNNTFNFTKQSAPKTPRRTHWHPCFLLWSFVQTKKVKITSQLLSTLITGLFSTTVRRNVMKEFEC